MIIILKIVGYTSAKVFVLPIINQPKAKKEIMNFWANILPAAYIRITNA